MKYQLFISMFILATLVSCSETASQKINEPNKNDRKVGGSCEGCEAIYESTVHFNELNAIDTLPDFNHNGPKLIVQGKVYKSDGVTPAAGVVLYAYHTDQKGEYPKKGNEKGWAQRHGYLRGWVKTDKNGNYQFVTLKPASYPNSNNPAHIHITVKEPGVSEYWIDDYVFDDDPYLNDNERNRTPRGSSGILKLGKRNGILYGERNIVLGKNVPGY